MYIVTRGFHVRSFPLSILTRDRIYIILLVSDADGIHAENIHWHIASNVIRRIIRFNKIIRRLRSAAWIRSRARSRYSSIDRINSSSPFLNSTRPKNAVTRYVPHNAIFLRISEMHLACLGVDSPTDIFDLPYYIAARTFLMCLRGITIWSGTIDRIKYPPPSPRRSVVFAEHH